MKAPNFNECWCWSTIVLLSTIWNWTRAGNLDVSKASFAFSCHGNRFSPLRLIFGLEDSEDWKSIVLGYSKIQFSSFSAIGTLTCVPGERARTCPNALPKILPWIWVSPRPEGGLSGKISLGEVCVPVSNQRALMKLMRSVLEKRRRRVKGSWINQSLLRKEKD